MTGTLEAVPDVESGIYIVLENGTAYEACLSGEQGFSAYLPQISDSVRLADCQGGAVAATQAILLERKKDHADE